MALISFAACAGDAAGATRQPDQARTSAKVIGSTGGDFDGSRPTQRLSVLLDGATWRVELDSPLHRMTEDLAAIRGEPVGHVQLLGAGDVNGDGRDEAALQLWMGASTNLVGFLGVAGEHFALATVIDGPNSGQNAFAVSGTVTHLNGVECEAGGRLEFSEWLAGTAPSKLPYSWTEADYRWSGLKLYVAAVRHGQLNQTAPPTLRYQQFTCPAAGVVAFHG